MHLPAAYIIVVLIWSTTPLAMKWSTAAGFFHALGYRIVLASAIALAIGVLLRRPLPMHRDALRMYVFGGLTLTCTQVLFYWAAQFIPSGWISVIFGLAPICTGLIASFFPGEPRMTGAKLCALLLSVAGLALIAHQGKSLGANALPGIGAALLATITYAVTLTGMKRLHAGVEPFATMAGSHYVSLLVFAVAWPLLGMPVVLDVPVRAALSIVYLALAGSILAATLFFYLLRHLDTTRIAMINLITPMLAVLAGHVLNDEPFNTAIACGTALVVAGLMAFQFGARSPGRARAGPSH